jgi:hypothetical protein
MATWARRAGLFCLACTAGSVWPADETVGAIDTANPRLNWRFYPISDGSCVIAGTAVSELRSDAFELQFRKSPFQKLRLFVVIPGLPKGGSLYMESPVTRERWRIFTESYVPALEGEKAEALQRNVAGGVSLHFTFEFSGRRVKYETISRGASTASSYFRSCVLSQSQKFEAKSK